MNTQVLAKTLALLAQHRVKRFKGNGLDIELDPVGIQSQTPTFKFSQHPNPELATAPVSTPIEQQQPIDPNNFTGNDMMSFDKILHWSSSPEVGDTGLPLTGDQPIEPGVIPTPVAGE